MPPRTNPGTPELAAAIRSRREALGLTIDGAARRAGVGTKTWARYEGGSSIRQDKVPGILKALNWRELPTSDYLDCCNALLSIDSSHEAWSKYLEETFGTLTAKAFAYGSDLVFDYARQDLDDLASLPRGTHLGELNVSWLVDSLPPQFLTRYDYEFVYAFLYCVVGLRRQAKYGSDIVAHTVMEEIAIYIIESEAQECLEEAGLVSNLADECPEGLLGELCGDIDVVTFLYSDFFLVGPGDDYYFDEWTKPQFYVEG